METSRVSLRSPHLIATLVATAHVLGFLTTWYYVATSPEGQAPMIWLLWTFIDLPFSLLYEPTQESILVIHGIFGPIWWYLIAYFVGKYVLFHKTH